MKKQKGILILLSALLIILEMLPYGAVLNTANSPETGGVVIRETCSFFSLQPFGQANYFPMIIAVLSCVLMCLVLICVFTNKALGAIRILSLIIGVVSLFPIVMGVSHFSVVGIAITVIAFAAAVWSFAIGQTAKQE